MQRRKFLRPTLLGAGALVLSQHAALTPSWAAGAADSRIEVLPAEVLGTISPYIYGHFTEHLGGVIYDGVWVGRNSKVPNIDGIRRALVEQMRKMNVPVVRYPGGCFARSCDWRDGVGPVDKRPRRTNFWANDENAQSPASHKYEPNEFGTNEFAFLPTNWQSALPRRQCAQSFGKAVLPLGGVLYSPPCLGYRAAYSVAVMTSVLSQQ